MILDNVLKTKYVFTITGGRWGYQHDLYAITPDNACKKAKLLQTGYDLANEYNQEEL